MELAYLPDSITLINGRRPYRPQESWMNVNSQYSVHKNYKSCPEKKMNEKNCEICKEKKKKILSNYIRLRASGSEQMTYIPEENEEESKKKINKETKKCNE